VTQRALVTGGQGFVAQWAIRAMIARGWNVTAAGVSHGAESTMLRDDERQAVDWVTMDVTDGDQIAAAVERAAPDVVLHLAAYQGPDLDYDHAIKVNAEATGLILQHCRTARAALVMSTHSVYRPWDDPMHVFLETDPLGDVHSTHCPTYSVSKIGQEAVARFCARAFDFFISSHQTIQHE